MSDPTPQAKSQRRPPPTADISEPNTRIQDLIILTIASLPNEDPAGIDIVQEIRRTRRPELKERRVYDNLDSLADDGFVEKVSDPESLENTYRLTADGKQYVVEHLSWCFEMLGVDALETIEDVRRKIGVSP